MRHDYNLPPGWDSMTAEERCRWLTQERTRRQAVRQQTASSRIIKSERESLMIELVDSGWVHLRHKR